MNAADFLRQEISRRESYKLLSAFYFLPEAETVQSVAALQTAMRGPYPQAAEYVSKMGSQIEIERLKLDFARLFVGPYRLLAPPYGSVYLEDGRKVMGNSTVDAKNRYVEAGLDISQSIKETPDHIAIELEFMYYLIFKEIEALERDDFRSALNYLDRQTGFLRNHLAAWVPRFADSVIENAETGFYQNLAQATRRMIQEDANQLLEVSVRELSALTEIG